MTVWEIGSYQQIAKQLVFSSELLAEDLEPHAQQKVLDIGTGTGNIALSLARRGCDVVGIDPAKKLLAIAKKRADAEGVTINFQNQTAELLPFPDATFDSVVSTFTLGFTKDWDLTIKEMMRVLKPGGKIGITHWSYSGYIVEFETKVNTFLGKPPTMPPHFTFGDDKKVKELFSPYLKNVVFKKRKVLFRFNNSKHWVDVFRSYFGPIHSIFNKLSKDKQLELEKLMVDILDRANLANDGTLLLPEDYLDTIGIKK